MSSFRSPSTASSPLPAPSPALRPALKHPSRPSSPSPFQSPSPPMSPPANTIPLASAAIHSTSINSSPSLPASASYTSAGFPRTDSTGSAVGAKQATNAAGSGYTTKVSFDTFMNPSDDAMFSFTLQVKSEEYKKNRNTRVYLCAASGDESGMQALEWAMESLVEDGDELVVVRGFDTVSLAKDQHESLREEARELMKHILDKNSEFEGRKLLVVVEFVAGKVTQTIDKMIALYRPDSLVVGTRGSKSLMQTWGAALGPGVGSVSRYCVSHSPVPVIVVQPERKVKKTMEKRRANPKRRAAFEQLTKTRTTGSIGTSL